MSYSSGDQFTPLSTLDMGTYGSPSVSDPLPDPTQLPISQAPQNPATSTSANTDANAGTDQNANNQQPISTAGLYQAPQTMQEVLDGAINANQLFQGGNLEAQAMNGNNAAVANLLDDTALAPNPNSSSITTDTETQNDGAGPASNWLSNMLSGVSSDQWMKTIGGAVSGLEAAKLQNRALDIQQQNANDNSELTALKAQQQSNESNAAAFNMGILAKNMHRS